MSRSATTRLKVNPPLGSLPVLQYCSPDQLLIDADYQRSLEAANSQTLIRPQLNRKVATERVFRDAWAECTGELLDEAA